MTSTPKSYDVSALRQREFPALAECIFMNAASFGPLPRRSLAAVDDFNARRIDVRRFGDTDIPDAQARARAAAAALIGADASEIALGPNTQVGLNLAAAFVLQALQSEGGWGGRRRIVLSANEFPANVYPWLALEPYGAIVQIVPPDELGRPREEALLQALEQEDVGVFALSAVQFASGWRADLARFGRIAQERSILYVVDAIQALGAVPLDVREGRVDVLSSGGQKWLCGPWGSGFTYVRSDLIPHLEPLFPGWISFTSSLDFTRLCEYGRELLPDARRYEMATVPAQDAIGMASSIELMLELGGPEAIWRHIQEVQAPLLEWAAQRDDVVVVSELAEGRRSGILCFRPPRVDEVFAHLRAEGVIGVVREGAIRLSPHFYNTVDEMRRVVALLRETLGE